MTASAALGPRSPRGPAGALLVHRAPAVPTAAVLLLHGGRAEGMEPPPLVNLPALRMRPFVAAATSALDGRRVLVGEVRYRRRGWNGDRRDPAKDAQTALDVLRERAGPLPVVLIGHSMGGRAALRVGGDPMVRGVIALAPWLPAGEPVAHLAGRRIYVLHDPADRVTAASDSWAFVHRAAAAGAEAAAIPMAVGGHTMLRSASTWHQRVAQLTAGLLADD
ncbi:MULTISPECIES: alpha/beta fold hydrolase [unclassified Streptomyces]|uniref:alpha/beta fold hydrolase n=1 Tax=unclassified Streptomyces TaxID=2593676 RepID=UPI001AE43AE9|nr:alpha/beta fold hydrolase [Streptomyces sp. KCTC 0041BP]MBP0938259.1 alpha/beta fold hydrolase [Streptomyces sp. KCTC 0041BP]